MDSDMTRCARLPGRLWRRLIAPGILFAGLAYSVIGYGEMLPDPTRPSADLGAAGGYAGAAAEGEYVLQSVLISRTRKAAIIGGATVEQGGAVGEARLVTVNETGVVLRTPEGLMTLKLFPGVEKRMTGKETSKPGKRAPAPKKSKGEDNK